jgi:hypothetical protein
MKYIHEKIFGNEPLNWGSALSIVVTKKGKATLAKLASSIVTGYRLPTSSYAFLDEWKESTRKPLTDR